MNRNIEFSNLRAHLENLKFPEPIRAEKLLLSLAKTPSERAALHRVLDVLIRDLSDAPDALLSLLNLTNVADSVEDRAAFLAQLLNADFRSRLCRVMSWSQALADTIIRRPELLHLVVAESRAISRSQLRVLANEATRKHESESEQIEALRRFRREQTIL